jgi:hypothetical protein
MSMLPEIKGMRNTDATERKHARRPATFPVTLALFLALIILRGNTKLDSATL